MNDSLGGRDLGGLRPFAAAMLEARGLASSTISHHLLPLSGTFAFAIRRGLASVNPYALLTADDRPRTAVRRQAYEWSDEEIEGLLQASELIAHRRESQYDYSPLLRVAVRTGLRLGELLGLQWQDIDLESGVLHVRRQWTRTGELGEPKTAKALRRVPLSPDVVAFLKRHKMRSRWHESDQQTPAN